MNELKLSKEENTTLLHDLEEIKQRKSILDANNEKVYAQLLNINNKRRSTLNIDGQMLK